MVVTEVREDETRRREHKREDLREEIRKLETPHIRDVKSALLDSLAAGLLGKSTNREKLTELRGFCELGLTQLVIHSFVCKCPAIPTRMRLTPKLIATLKKALVGITVPQMSYRDERDRAAGLVKSYWSVPDLGKSFESYAQPDRQERLAVQTQEDIAHRLLNSSMLRIVSIVSGLLQVHGVLPFEQAEPSFNIADILGVTQDDGTSAEEPEEEAAAEEEPAEE